MKPNDQAYQAAIDKYADTCGIDFSGSFENRVKSIVDAAYAAQFPPSEDYAGLVKELRKVEPDLPGDRTRWYRNPNGPDAADALEALLVERDELDKWLRESKQNFMRVDIERNNLRAERDALLARLAPVDDKALVEIAVTAIHKEAERGPVFGGNLIPAVIAAIRPHIEAAERERCAKAVITVAKKINVAPHERPAYEDGYLQGVHDAAAAIRSAK